MPSARDLVMRELAAIRELAENNNRMLRQILDDEQLFGEDDYDEETFAQDIGHEPRTTVIAKSAEGVEFHVDWNELDPRMQEAIQISRQQGTPYQLYEDANGKLRIMVANEVSAIIHKRHTPQG